MSSRYVVFFLSVLPLAAETMPSCTVYIKDGCVDNFAINIPVNMLFDAPMTVFTNTIIGEEFLGTAYVINNQEGPQYMDGEEKSVYMNGSVKIALKCDDDLWCVSDGKQWLMLTRVCFNSTFVYKISYNRTLTLCSIANVYSNIPKCNDENVMYSNIYSIPYQIIAIIIFLSVLGAISLSCCIFYYCFKCCNARKKFRNCYHTLMI